MVEQFTMLPDIILGLMNKFLYLTVFTSGMTTLVIELSASRLIGNVFGTSNLVWASIIGLILIYLTVGYYLGGRWADRSPHAKTMYIVLTWGAFLSGLIPMVSTPVLWLAADAFDQLQVGILFGSFASVLILFSIPVTLLGTISPFAIRLAVVDARRAGTIAGQIYAVSTLGSFIGTFLPVLVFIPLIGTARTFLTFSLLLMLVALVGLYRYAGRRVALFYAWMPLVLILLIIWGSGPVKKTSGQIYETESAYNYIQVLEQNGYRLLRLNEGQGIHSVWHPTQLSFNGTWEQFLAAPFFNQPPYRPEDVQNMAIVGLAAGTTAFQATAVFGAIPIDGFEIDPKIIEVGREYFSMTEPNLHAIAEDGRWGLEHSPSRYSVIGIDAYRPPYIPFHLTTQEFFQIVYDHLREDGVLAINVGRSPSDRRLIDGLVSTLQTVFPSVYVMDLPESFNSMVYATRKPTEIAYLFANYDDLNRQGDVHPLLIEVLQKVILYQQPTPQGGMVFTDDWAPIEWITNKMVLNYVLSGDVESLHK
jgi:predicted membrane-bound spermidine synthase